MSAAQAGTRAPQPKRFYKEAGVEERDGAFHLTLDGRTARTPARQPLAVPARGVAEAMAQEWAEQRDEIDPTTMPVTRIVNSALDAVQARRAEVIDDVVKYAASDLTCYRAGGPARLVAEQNVSWDPVILWAKDTMNVQFALAEGVIHVPQPQAALDAVRARVQAVESPIALAALHVMTTLTGSVLIALAHAAGRLDADEAWRAAHVDELYQESVWGEDYEAATRRQRREAEFKAASRVFRLASG